MKRIVAAVLAVLVVTSVASAPVTAQSDDGLWGDLVTKDSGLVAEAAAWVAEATGTLARLKATVLGDGTTASAATYATDLQDAFNAHNETIEAYVNARLTADTSHDVAAIHLHDRSGGNATVYLVSTVANGNWTDARLVSEARFQEVNRSPDFWLSLDWYASRHADDELVAFVDEYASPGQNASTAYRLTLVSKYGSGIKSSLWGATDPSFSD